MKYGLSLWVASWAARSHAYDNGAPNSRMPMLGWSSWVALSPKTNTSAADPPKFDFCDEASVIASIDAFMEVGLYEAGYRHFHLDDCWADLERNASGFLQAERDHFPKGMKPIVDYAHSKGLTFGLYTCAGNYTCVGKRPGSRGHWTQDANVFAEWGVDVVKMDWCYSDGLVPREAYTAMSRAMNATGRAMHLNMCEWGRDEPWKWGPSVAQSWRATGDHVPVWSSTQRIIAERTKIPPELGGAPYAWNDMDMVETGNYAQAAHANGKQGTMTAAEYKTEFSMWAILASPLIVTTPIVNCSQTDQIRGKYKPGPCRPSITALQKEILLNTEVLAINQDVTPAGRLLSPSVEASDSAAAGAPESMDCHVTKQASTASCKLGDTYGCFIANHSMWTANGCRGVFSCNGVRGVECDVLHSTFAVCDCSTPKPSAALVYGRNLTDGSFAVALYNPTPVAGYGAFDFTLFGWGEGSSATVRDLWARSDNGTFVGRFPAKGTISVEAHGAVLLRLRAQTEIVI